MTRREFFWNQFFREEMRRREVSSLGSGFLISEDGYIVTNAHVVENADEITVNMAGAQKYIAELIIAESSTDIALLKIEGSGYPFLELGNSEDIIVGEWAIAFGNPFGLFEVNDQPSITVGVVSAVNRDFGMYLGERYYDDMIQTDASINSGNSGGPLINSLGQVIGVNTFIITGGGDQGSSGVGFAIPANKIQRMINAVQSESDESKPYYTGIRSVIPVSRVLQRQFGLDSRNGAVIADIESNSPASRSGLQRWDVIIETNKAGIEKPQDILDEIDKINPRPGKKIELTIIRGGRRYTAEITLGIPPRREQEEK